MNTYSINECSHINDINIYDLLLLSCDCLTPKTKLIIITTIIIIIIASHDNDMNDIYVKLLPT